ncbi:DUF2147 domain-containing protein [Lacihabitans soyangensis]|uniref:DUF2147 domain-containing protein n=1 Tax=Lacihabitans soyangensis TaxID=869394 RepID=A0AAE3H6D4_9BACT|nr:DUF2147 domain-containing protein [Lacihabitans soyangensis]MCP9765677.1 DUF2147 domain-containing protein [Lacihabitans soyangensis]
MKKLPFILFILFVNPIFSQTSNPIIGTWLTQDKKAHVEINYINGKYHGKIAWLKFPFNPKNNKYLMDENNPDPSKKGMPLLNSLILWDFIKEGDEYVKGKVYDSRDGKTYSGKLWLNNDFTLKMRGYWGLFYKTETWTKVK